MTDKRAQLEALAAAADTGRALARLDRCEQCGYSLAGLDPGSRCPECGMLSGVNTVTAPLSEVDPRVLRRIGTGVRIAGAAGVWLGVWGTLAIVLHVVDRLPPEVRLLAHPLVGGVLAVVASIGLWMFASVIPNARTRSRTTAARLITLGSTATIVGLLALPLVLFIGVEDIAVPVLGTFAALGLALSVCASVPYGASLVARIPDWRLARLLEDLQFIVPLVAIVGLCAFVGPALAVVLWGVAMLKLGARLRSVAPGA